MVARKKSMVDGSLQLEHNKVPLALLKNLQSKEGVKNIFERV